MRIKPVKITRLMALFFPVAMAAFFSGLWPPTATAGESMLLSDQVIEEITGRSGTIITFLESPGLADVPHLDRWHPYAFYPFQEGERSYSFWGGGEGLSDACAGYLVVEFPYENFQWQHFRYSFADEKTAAAFKAALVDQNRATPTATTLIKSNPSADTLFLDDGSAPRVMEVIVTTDRQVAFHFVNRHGGTVIEEKVHFELTFDEPYRTKNTYQKTGDPVYNRPISAYTYSHNGIAGDDLYEWRRTDYGAVFLSRGATDGTPLTVATADGPAEIVPANTAYLVSTTSAGIRIYSPRIGFTVGLAPAGNPFQPAHWALEGQEYFPDMGGYQKLFDFDITGLNIHISGGTPIYIYTNPDPVH